MDDGIELAAFGEHIGDRLPEMTGLGGETVLLVDIEMRLHGSRPDAIGSMIDEHVNPPLGKQERPRARRIRGILKRISVPRPGQARRMTGSHIAMP